MKKDADYVFYELTRSICPKCRRVIDAHRDDAFLVQLAEVRPFLYFQFDGFESNTYRVLRGEPDLAEEKIRALDRLASAGLSATLAPAIERGVNEHEIGRIIELNRQGRGREPSREVETA